MSERFVKIYVQIICKGNWTREPEKPGRRFRNLRKKGRKMSPTSKPSVEGKGRPRRNVPLATALGIGNHTADHGGLWETTQQKHEA